MTYALTDKHKPDKKDFPLFHLKRLIMIEAMLQASGASAEDLARINSVIDAIQQTPERIESLEAMIEELNKTVINSVIEAIQRTPERIESLEAKIEELNKTVQAMREE